MTVADVPLTTIGGLRQLLSSFTPNKEPESWRETRNQQIPSHPRLLQGKPQGQNPGSGRCLGEKGHHGHYRPCHNVKSTHNKKHAARKAAKSQAAGATTTTAKKPESARPRRSRTSTKEPQGQQPGSSRCPGERRDHDFHELYQQYQVQPQEAAERGEGSRRQGRNRHPRNQSGPDLHQVRG